MSERDLLFDSVDGDRVTLAEDFAAYFKHLNTTGIWPAYQNELEVTPSDPEAMKVLVHEGAAMINGYYLQVYDAPTEHTIRSADATGTPSTESLINNTTETGTNTGWSVNTNVTTQDFNGDTINVLEIPSAGDVAALTDIFDIDPTKEYRLSMYLKKTSNIGRTYVGLDVFDATSTEIGIDRVDQNGSLVEEDDTNFYWYYTNFNQSPTDWVQLVGYILPSGSAPSLLEDVGTFPAGTVDPCNAIFNPPSAKLRIRVLNFDNVAATSLYVAYAELVEVSVAPRIDRIVARLDLANRRIETDVLEGTPADTPVAPSLTRNASIYELSLAQIAVGASTSAITESEITDEREDPDLCGFSSSLGTINLNGAVMEGSLDLNAFPIKNIRRLFFESRYGETSETIGLTESGTTGELLFSVYDADQQFVEFVGAIHKDSILREDRISGIDDVRLIRLGPETADGEKYFEPKGTAFRVKYNDASYLFVGSDTVAFYMNEEPVHVFRANGTKTGGSMRLGRELWGMSPTDSPRSLIEDVRFSVDVSGDTFFAYDERFRSITRDITVLLSNPNIRIREKTEDGVWLVGEGKTDISLQGKRHDRADQYFVPMPKKEA